MSESGLKSIVADLHDMGYSNQEIARVMGRCNSRIGQILAEVCPRPPYLMSVDDLPFHMKQRVELWKQQNGEELQPLQVASPATT